MVDDDNLVVIYNTRGTAMYYTNLLCKKALRESGGEK